MTVVYVDSVFCLNTLMDYLLLRCTARLAGVPPRRWRLLLAAALGGGYAVAVFLPGCGFLSALPVKLAAGAALALTAFGAERRLLRLTLLFLAVSCGFAGCVLALGLLSGTNPVVNGVFYTQFDAKVLAISAAAAYAVLSVVFHRGARHEGGELYQGKLSLWGKEVAFTALHDSGNTLDDPLTGEPVLVIWAGAAEALWPPQLRALLGPKGVSQPVAALEKLHAAAPEQARAFRLLPYRAVGVAQGMLLAVHCDWMELDGVRYPGQVAALSATEVSDGGGYAALWGGEKRKVAKGYGTLAKAAGTAGTVRTAAARQGDVHRGERHTAAAPEPGRGGGASKAFGPGGCPSGADRAEPKAGGIHRPAL